MYKECTHSFPGKQDGSYITAPPLPPPESLPPCGLQRVLVFSKLPLQFGFSWRVYAGIGWLVCLTERISVCSATPHFSARSSFMIGMRVFFQETHISLFDLGASVRIFFNTTLAF